MAILLVHCAAAAEISKVEIVPENPTVDDEKFYVKAYFNGDTCGTNIAFSMDEKTFFTKNIGCGAEVQLSSGLDIDKYPCGVYTASVRLSKGDTVLSNVSRVFETDNVLNVNVSPERPATKDTVKITVSDTEGKELSESIRIAVLNEDDDEVVSEYTKSDLSFKPAYYGRYRVYIGDPLYCVKEQEVYVKKVLPVDGPRPSNPVVGDVITIAIPSDVGIKIIDSNCTPCMFPKTTISGGANFTIDKPGTYIIVIGENSREYWSVNKTLIVSAKGAINTVFSPENPILGKPLTISVTSGGNHISEADVKLTRPTGVVESYKTTPDGTVVVAPQDVGRYTLTIKKEKFETATQSFEPKNSFSVQMPQVIVVGQNATINVRDQYGNPVVNAQIFINGAAEGRADSGGNFVAEFGKAGVNKVTITKDTYLDYEADVDASGVMEIVAPAESELGETVAVSTRDARGNTIESTIEITKPDGNKNSVSGSFVPAAAGIYKITAVKTDYKTAEITINVNPRPLNLSITTDGGFIVIAAASRKAPVAGIELEVKTPTRTEALKTDANGIAKTSIETGSIVVASKSDEYEKIVETHEVIKRRNYPLLLVIAVIIIGVVYLIGSSGKEKEAKPKEKESKLATAHRRMGAR